jgi:biopolymer transport protein TolR
MAIVAGVASSARGRRALDASLNLVPFIDLLSCCIAFLLITAVWSAVARIDVVNAGASATAVEDGPPTPPPWTLYVARDSWMLRAPDGATLAAAPATLASLLRAHSVGEPLMVRATDDVEYAELVDALDVTRSVGIRTISLGGSE